ncbi:MAG: hypothetical protein ABIQ32_03375 [Sphingomicrobium sp.]
MHRSADRTGRAGERVAWILDDVWPETASMVQTLFNPGDQLLTPGIFRGFPARYDWPVARPQHPARRATLLRHWAMRRSRNASGARRQESYLRQDRSIALRLGKFIDFRARHLVVAQSWLPWLDEAGALGGRSFDVVMSRYPLAEIHCSLDEAAEAFKSSATIGDFRAEPELVERELRLLARARRIITPHHGIAALFGDRAQLLAWHRPRAAIQARGNRVAFLGPTIARQRPDLVRAIASSLNQPLIVFGPMLEQHWDAVAIERRAYGPRSLQDVGALLHPATITHQPRLLLAAIASGITVYATPTCGLAPTDYLALETFRETWSEQRTTQAPLVTAGTAG